MFKVFVSYIKKNNYVNT